MATRDKSSTFKRFLRKSESYGKLHEVQKAQETRLTSDSSFKPTSNSRALLSTPSLKPDKKNQTKSGSRIKQIFLTPLRYAGQKVSPRYYSRTNRTPSRFRCTSHRASLCVNLNSALEAEIKKDEEAPNQTLKSRFEKCIPRFKKNKISFTDKKNGSLTKQKRCSTLRLRETEKFNSFFMKTTSNTLEAHIKNKVTLQRFCKFLEKEFNEENLEFWLEVEKYKQAKEKNRKKYADNIFKNFILWDSPKEINLDGKVRKSLLAKRESSVKDLFDLAQNQIFKLMEKDPFPRYLAQTQKNIQS